MNLLSAPKRCIVGLSTLVLMVAMPLTSAPVRAQLTKVTTSIAAAIQQPEVKLNLTAEKQRVKWDSNGQEVIVWDELDNQAFVQPGDVLRYTVVGGNAGSADAGEVTIIQPIPAQLTYILGSATSAIGASITYSIDNGETFVETPMVEVVLPDGTTELQPAPAEAYSHINWYFPEPLTADTEVNASYQVTVK